MSGSASVDRAAMNQAAGQIEEKANAISATQTKLQGEVTGLIGSGWQGNAANAFLRAFNDFDNQFVKVKNALDDIHTKLVDSHVKYSSTEDEQAQSTNAISALLNES